MKNTSQYLVAVSGFILSAGLAHADGEKCDSPMHNQSSVSRQGITFKNVDANKDGKITLDEMQDGQKHEMGRSDGTTHLDQRFKAADANHDGGLNMEEASAMPMLSAYFGQVDANKDGKVTHQEYFDAMPLLHRSKPMDTSGKSQTL